MLSWVALRVGGYVLASSGTFSCIIFVVAPTAAGLKTGKKPAHMLFGFACVAFVFLGSSGSLVSCVCVRVSGSAENCTWFLLVPQAILPFMPR